MLPSNVRKIEITESDGTPYTLPYWDIDSGLDGPCVLITAALHGTELNGCEVIRRCVPVIRRRLARGRCLMAPFANLRAFQKHQPHIDYEFGKRYCGDRKFNINSTWPGDAAGSSAQRATAAIKTALVDRATHNIDLHSWNHTWAAAVLPRKGYEPSLQLARATGLRFARGLEWEPHVKERPVTPCTLTSYFNDTGRAAICIEFSGQNIIIPAEVRSGERAVRNCLRVLEMLPGELEEGDRPQVWVEDAKATDVTAPCSGLYVLASPRLAAPVKKGARLGLLLSDEKLRTHVIRAPMDGYLQKHGCLRKAAHELGNHHNATHPYAEKGELLACILTP